MSINIIKVFHNKTTILDIESASKEFMHPTRDWMLILGCSVFLFIGGVAYSAYDFYVQFGKPNEESLVEERYVRYRDKEVMSVAASYAEIEARFSALRSKKPIIPEAPAASSASNTPTQLEGVTTENTPLAEIPVGEYTESAPTLSP